MMAIKIDLQKGNVRHEEFMSFIKGGASLDLNAVTAKPFKWILDITWLNLVEINKLPTFSEILTKVSRARDENSDTESTFQIEHNEKEWRYWYEKERPEEEDIPCGYNKCLDVFRKLILIRSWSPDRTLSQANKYIMGTFTIFTRSIQCKLNLQILWETSTVKLLYWI